MHVRIVEPDRRGMKKAAVAVARRILILPYHVIRDGVEYRELGGDYFDRLHLELTAMRLLRRLSNIGYDVTLEPRETTTAEQPLPRLRGRPCKCAERGVPCVHLGRAPQETRVTTLTCGGGPPVREMRAWRSRNQ